MDQPRSSGIHTVRDTIYHVERNLSINTNGMLLRMALIESDFGENPNTFNDQFVDHTGFHSIGIWQITDTALNETKNNCNLNNYRDQIQQIFGINWSRVSMDHMKTPLHCCLAVYLYIKFAELAWPNDAVVGWPDNNDIYSQATKWKNHFNRNPYGVSINEFINKCNSHHI